MTSSKSKITVTILNALLLMMMLLVATGSSTIAAPPLDGPYDAQSTTGPVPPPGIERGELSAPSLGAAAVVVLDVPTYIWHNGCGPTAAGMVIGYWDGNGFDNLVSGSADTQTTEVDAMISSSGNYDDYCLPIDSSPNLLPDKSEPPEGDEHPDDCVADLMKTSQSFHYNYYGWSWFSHVDDALQGYVPMVAPEYSATAENQTWSTFTWSSYRAEIDAGHPVVLLVDTDADGSTDHFVTAIGYSDEGGTNMYACRDTWDTGVHWFEFAQMASGQPWGIFGATLFQISTNVGPVVYDSHTVDDDNLDNSSGNDDGTVDPGETIELYVDLYNQGSSTATGVNATISTSDPYVTFLYNTSSGYPDIPGGGTGTNSDDFDFGVTSSTPDGHVICFDLDITSSNGGPWSDSFCVTAGGGANIYLPIVLKDSSTMCSDTQLVQNGGFESGNTIWVQQSGPYTIISQQSPRTDSWSAWFGDYDSADDRLYQSISIPADISSARLTLYLHVDTQDSLSTPYDYWHVELQDSSGGTLQNFLWVDNTLTDSGWYKGTVDWNSFASHAGTTRRLFFQGTTNSTLYTNFFVDDVTLWAYCGSLPAATGGFKGSSDGWTWEKVDSPPRSEPFQAAVEKRR